jgi:hypothetical protein
MDKGRTLFAQPMECLPWRTFMKAAVNPAGVARPCQPSGTTWPWGNGSG